MIGVSQEAELLKSQLRWSCVKVRLGEVSETDFDLIKSLPASAEI